MILDGKTWLGWIGRTGGAVSVWLGGALVALREAGESIPKPPDNPDRIGPVQQIATTSAPVSVIAIAPSW